MCMRGRESCTKQPQFRSPHGEKRDTEKSSPWANTGICIQGNFFSQWQNSHQSSNRNFPHAHAYERLNPRSDLGVNNFFTLASARSYNWNQQNERSRHLNRFHWFLLAREVTPPPPKKNVVGPKWRTWNRYRNGFTNQTRTQDFVQGAQWSFDPKGGPEPCRSWGDAEVTELSWQRNSH